MNSNMSNTRRFPAGVNYIKFLVYVLGNSIQRVSNSAAYSAAFTGISWVHSRLAGLYVYLLRDFTLFSFKTLIDLSMKDYIGKKFRFSLFYLLLSYSSSARMAVFSQVKDATPLLSVSMFFDSAGWPEREVWDMFGFYFIGNKFMVRLLTDYGFKGFPLRKDFPLTGFKEVFYDDYQKKLLYDLVELMQEYRVFTLKIKRWS